MKNTKAELVPMVVESSGKGERAFDIYSRLLRDRIIFINGEITHDVATTVMAQMLFLELEKTEPIHMYIMSPGGSLDAAFAIYDLMQHVSSPVATYCIGSAASAGAFLLLSGAKGMRYALPSSRIMIHQPWGGCQGDVRSMKIQYTETEKVKDMMYERMAKHTGKSKSQIEKDCDRDYFMDPNEAIKYGIIDKVMQPRVKVKEKKNA